MQGDPQVIHFLQAQLKNERTAINQYFVHYRMFKHWGFDKMAKKEYEESIGENLVEAPGCDLKSERAAQATIKDGIAACEVARDHVSRDLLQHILGDTEEHIDFLETQLDLVGTIGEQNCLQSQMGG